MGNNDYLRRWNKNKIANLLLTAFFIVSFIEVTAEYNEDMYLIWLTKPLILPLLMAYYIRRSAKANVFFSVALLFCWLANLFFIESTWNYILLGVVSFLVYRILVIGIVLKKVKMPSFFPLIIGSIPFLFIYASVAIFTFSTLGDSLYLFLVQGAFTIFLGGLSLGNYMMTSNKPNRILFVSTILFAFNQFVFLLRFYYEEANLFQAISMILFVWAQYLLTKYMLNTEKQKSRYLIVNKLNEVG
ncbi:lysoplasmalogenase family protein [Flavobacterium sp.]|uniref:lysoplasmalogenase family protein n=1 Tax=Flavobacterium sp. TaxID=239 RepID=UPI0025E4C819|nr:lysoplasmalogenase family protein [Flavobacterium sp.]